MLRRIKYTCKNCGWSKQIPEQWADLKPRRCGNPKCNTSFILDKEKLDILKPEKVKKEIAKVAKKVVEISEEESKDEKNEKSDSKSKRSSKTKQQSKQEEKVEEASDSE